MYGAHPPPPHDDQGNRPVKRARNTLDDPLAYHHRDGMMLPAPPGLEEYPATPTPMEAKKGGRQDTAGGTPRTQDKDKNRKLSCKECRRLKLKCDRVFPCQSCVKRGCGSLCPEGALTSGRGSRFILANTEQLHEKITVLSDRVRDLEDALHALQSTCSNHPHPLLSPELLRIKTSQDLYIAPQPASLSQQQQQPNAGPSGLDGEDLHHSTSALSLSHPTRPDSTTPSSSPNPHYLTHHQPQPHVEQGPPEVPPDILQLSGTFPFPWSVDLRIRKRIRDALPSRHEAQAICEEARRNALWQYHLDASETFLQNLLHHCYSTTIEDLSPRRLALLLMILSIGSLVDLNRPLGSLYGEAYHHLARASVCEIPLMEEPDFDVLHALFFMIWWHLIFSDNKKAVGYAWNLMGFVAKLAQGLGLHRDNPRLKGIPEEDEKRRAVFWELLNLDARMSLSLGRPPSICLRHVDAKPPSFVGAGLYVPREEIIYHEWKNAFFIQCLTPILEAAVVVVDPPGYSTVLALDTAVRDFRVPPLLEETYVLTHTQEMQPRFLVMQRALVATSRDIALLQLHRRYFTEAMSRPEGFDLHHPYAPSVLATCLGAASLITSIEALFEHEPQLSARFLYFWFNAYSAAATLALFVSRAPATPSAPDAQKHLDRACRLFGHAAQILPLCRGLLHVTEKLADKSRQALKQYQSASALVGLHGSIGPREDNATPVGHVTPDSFQGAHPVLRRYVEEREHVQPPGASELSRSSSLHPLGWHGNGHAQGGGQGQGQGQEPWLPLPDIYRYANAGVNRELRYAFPVAGQVQTPFVPGAPRVNADEEYNFDHGALNVQCEETGYMAWF
ncbi:hypothetical protein FPV67DRAFT_1477758 [Lyophyllum atratum]|nr:hypothetical protein FPV67DRAFT_1477758 [Lyophyllum atratum]